jgi:hypothetical protein
MKDEIITLKQAAMLLKDAKSTNQNLARRIEEIPDSYTKGLDNWLIAIVLDAADDGDLPLINRVFYGSIALSDHIHLPETTRESSTVSKAAFMKWAGIPMEDEKERGGFSRHDLKAAQYKGLIKAMMILAPDECKNDKGKITQDAIVDRALNLFGSAITYSDRRGKELVKEAISEWETERK